LAHKAVVDKESSLLWIERRYINKDGQIIWCEVSSSPVFGYKGRTIYTVAHVQDITERKKAEEMLKLTLAELARSNEELEQFAYGSSHDLQESLWMITGICSFYKRDIMVSSMKRLTNT
jgi:hypothetical protein